MKQKKLLLWGLVFSFIGWPNIEDVYVEKIENQDSKHLKIRYVVLNIEAKTCEIFCAKLIE